jgi:hypothetical protein
MAQDFDLPPVYDPLLRGKKEYMAQAWISYYASFIDTLSSYLSTYGIFLPKLTTAQRNQIQSPQEGQVIYNTTLLAPQIFQTGVWKTFTTV